jgi:hypothetical protein
MARYVIGGLLSLALLFPALVPAADSIQVTDDRVYREGAFLVLDALAENRTGRPIDGVEVTVVFLDLFDGLVRAEHTVLRPVSLGPGQAASLRVAVPYAEGIRKLEYRFTWREAGAQLQARVRRDIWAGSAVR